MVRIRRSVVLPFAQTDVCTVQAPRTNAQPAKQALILAWIQKSGVAHNIKDLEKALPSVASINGMQVKDYLQALSDDNKIHVEKIGSGNWYWSFPSEERKAKERTLEKAKKEWDQAGAVIADLQAKVDEASAARGEGEERRDDEGCDRQSLLEEHAEAAKEVERLKKELAEYREKDPVEVEKRKKEALELKEKAGRWTDQVLDMEGWLKAQLGMDRETLILFKREMYGDEFDEEEEGLKEV